MQRSRGFGHGVVVSKKCYNILIPVLHYACIMPIPSLQLQKKTCLMQRNRRCGHGVVVSKICYVQYSDCVQDLDYRILIVLSVVTCDCCKPMNNCRNWAFSNSGLEAGLPAFQLPMYSMCDALPKKRFVRHVCLRNPCLLWNLSLHSLPEAWGPWEPQYTPPVLHYACIMPIPSLQLKKKTCLMQRSTAFGHAVVVSKICCNTVIVLSVVVWDCCKPTNNCRDWAFSHSGLEAGLPAFQLPMCSKCDTLRKGNLWDMLVGFRNPFPLFLAETFNSRRDQRVGKGEILSWESQSISNIVRVDVWVVNKWWNDFFAVKFLYPNFVVLPRSKQLMPVTTKFRLDFLARPAFQLPMFAKCDALPKGDLLDMFVYGIHAFWDI